MRLLGVFIRALIILAMAGIVDAQTIECDGHSCGGTGTVSYDGIVRDFVYRVATGAAPRTDDSIFIGTHDDDLSHYSDICHPPGWSYAIITELRDDHDGPTPHGRPSPGPTAKCAYTFLFYNAGGAPLSSTPADFGFNYYGYPHDVDWAIAASPPVSADWIAAVGDGAGPVHGPRCDTLCEHGQINWYFYAGGNHDDFNTGDGPEPSSPSQDLLTEMGNISAGANPFFDSNTDNRCFGHTFSGWFDHCCIDTAELCFRVTAISGGLNDNIVIREDAVNTIWAGRFGYLKSFLSGDPADTFWNVGDTLQMCLRLDDMPLMPRSATENYPTNILATVQDGDLDVIIQDDTKIDFLDLSVVTCEDCEIGACCLDDGTCVVVDLTECNQLGGKFFPGLTSCVPNPCCLRPPNGILAWWPLDEDGSNPPIAKDIARGHNGDFTIGTQPPGFAAGKVDGSFQFNWDNEAIVRASWDPFVEIGMGDFTIDAWIYPEARIDECSPDPIDYFCADRFIVSNEIYHDGIWFFVRENPVGNARLGLRMFVGSLPPIFWSDPLPSYAHNEWHHVAVTVSRSTGDGIFYFDGVPVSTPPFAPTPGLLYDPRATALDIGHGDPSAAGNNTYKNRYFGGWIDEVQIFERALQISEIEDIFLADDRGKCKQYCSVPRIITFCPNDPPKAITVAVYNDMDRDASYLVYFSTSGLNCPPGITDNSAGVITIPPTSPKSLFVPGGGSGNVQFTIDPPNPCVPGEVNCYEVYVVDQATGFVFRCAGSVKCVMNKYCPSDPYIGPPIDIFSVIPPRATADFSFENTGDASGVLNYEITVVSSCACDSTEDAILSLDGLIPGTNVTGSKSIPLGDTGTVSVPVELAEYKPFSIQEVVFMADLDDDEIWDIEQSIAYHPATFADCNENGIDDLDDIDDGSDDLNGNSIPDECEPIDLASYYGDANTDGALNVGDAVFMINYVFKNGPAPNPAFMGDTNADCALNVGDAVYMINYVFKQGDPPIVNDECEWPD